MLTFGHWTFLEDVGNGRWLCRCSCGVEKEVLINNLRRGLTKSCGKHGKPWQNKYDRPAKEIPEWRIWSGIKSRCYDPNSRTYKNYGGRGITMCERWRLARGDGGAEDGFANFFADMGPRPSDDHSVDRIDSAGPYSPENCRWATRSEQNRNRPNFIPWTARRKRKS